MTFRRVAVLIALVLFIFGLYLLQYVAYVLRESRGLYFQEGIARDVHGMSQLIGYTFMLMFGLMVLGLGLISWSCRHVPDLKSQKAISLAYFILGIGATSLAIFGQRVYWQSGWGQLYIVFFLLMTLLSGYFRFLHASRQR